MCRVYIAGPITGYVHYKEKFDGVEAKLLELGLETINPTNGPEEESYRAYIDRGIHQLRYADMICMLPGSATSRGAMLEFRYAQTIGMPILKANWNKEGWTISGYEGENP